jgi:hypothetical protein
MSIRRSDRPPDVEEIVPQLRDPNPHLARGPAFDALFELVDLFVQRIDQIEEVVGDQIDDVVDDHARALVGLLADRLVYRVKVAGLAALGCLADRYDTVPGRDDVDLLVVDPVLLADCDRQQEDSEEVVVVTFEPRPRLVVVHGRLEQLFERALVDLGGECLRHLPFSGVEEIDPFGHVAGL